MVAIFITMFFACWVITYLGAPSYMYGWEMVAATFFAALLLDAGTWLAGGIIYAAWIYLP